jgi:hypothetical protein
LEKDVVISAGRFVAVADACRPSRWWHPATPACRHEQGRHGPPVDGTVNGSLSCPTCHHS